jgi:hypothetical protein
MRSVYFTNGTRDEQYLLEDLTIESIRIYGQDMYYIPRILVAKDNILGEDRLSQFRNAYPIEMYLESVSGFEGQGAFINKFGLMMEQSATLTVARRTWERFVGKHSDATLPNRPAEGDLLYFPLTNGLFEIKFVEHQDPFYQLGKLYVYRLEVELFQYASEVIDTGISSLDAFESLKTFDVDKQDDIDAQSRAGDNNSFKQEIQSIKFDVNNPFGDVITTTPPVVQSITVDSTSITADDTTITADHT